MEKKPKELGLSELIYRIKQDLASEAAHKRDTTTVFLIDEITLEVNFVVSGDVESGFDLGIVSLGSQASQERVQKVTIKMTPLISRDDILKRLKGDAELWNKAETLSRRHLIKGDILGDDIPRRE